MCQPLTGWNNKPVFSSLTSDIFLQNMWKCMKYFSPQGHIYVD